MSRLPNHWLWLLAAALLLAAAGVYTAGAQTESRDAFCASCHLEPETTYYQQSLRPQTAVTLAAFHAGEGTRCIDCHSGRWIPGRVRAQWVGLHNLLSYRAGDFGQPSRTTRPLGDSSCTKCHSDLTWTSERPGHYHSPQLRRSWGQNGGPVNRCAACHSPHRTFDTHTAAFLDEADVEAQCDACHDSLEE